MCVLQTLEADEITKLIQVAKRFAIGLLGRDRSVACVSISRSYGAAASVGCIACRALAGLSTLLSLSLLSLSLSLLALSWLSLLTWLPILTLL